MGLGVAGIDGNAASPKGFSQRLRNFGFGQDECGFVLRHLGFHFLFVRNGFSSTFFRFCASDTNVGFRLIRLQPCPDILADINVCDCLLYTSPSPRD